MSESRLFAVGPLVFAVAVAGVVVLAALTSWWALFALFAVPPLLMMTFGVAMMTAMRRRGVRPFWAGPCAAWLRPDSARDLRAD